MLQVLTKMEGHHAKWKVEIQKCSKYHAQTLQLPCNMKGSIFQMPQVPCKMRGSISTMQVDIAECWQYCKHPANVYCAFLCFNLDSFACFFFLALQNLTEFLTSWLCLCSPFQCNQRHRRKEITNTAYTQAKTTKSTVIVCSFSYTTNSNSNNNNKKLPLQVQL